jgi:hypothetical protein
MALSNGSTTFDNGPLIFLNPRSQDKEGKKITPHFEIARVGEDKKIHKTEETCTKVAGDLRRPKFSTRDFKGTPVKHCTLYIHDGAAKETYSLDLTYRIASRQLFNALLSITDPQNVSISIYESKKGYEALSLWQGEGKNATLVPWKYDGRKGEIPEAITVKFKGKDQHDYTPVDDFFEEKLQAWADELFGPEKGGDKAADSTAAKSEVVKADKAQTASEQQKSSDEDVPF